METRRMCPHCRAFITTRDRVCPYCNEKVGPKAIDQQSPGEILGGLIPHARFTTVIILLINFGLFGAMVIYSSQLSGEGLVTTIDLRTLIRFGAKVRTLILFGQQWWRLVTAGFLHASVLHIFMNSWVLFDLGTQVEEVYGTSRLIVFYFVSSVFGFVASTYWSGAVSTGASAALFGLIGSMIALGVRHQTALGGAIKAQYVRWAIYGLLFGLLPGIDNAAHIGGLAAGFGCAYLAGLPRIPTARSEQLWRAAAYVCVALTLLCFVEMLRWFSTSAR